MGRLNVDKLSIALGNRFRRKDAKSLSLQAVRGSLYSPRGAALAERYDPGASFLRLA